MSSTEYRMHESILHTIKRMLGGVINEEDNTFDTDIVIHINSVLSALNQMGIGKANFEVTDDETWADFLVPSGGSASEEQKYQMVKSYVYFKVKQMFDPASSSIINQTIEANIKELEWRLHSLANY